MKYCKYFFIVYAIAILSSVGANAATTVTGLATPEYVKGAINSLGDMAKKDNVTNDDISGTIEQGKITGLTGALSGKQATLTTTNVKDSGTGNVVTGVSAANGVVTVTKGSITSANNPTITITQNGTTKGTFTLNQSGAATIALTDNNTTYGIANANTAGLVKSGNDITVDSTTGVVTVTHATKATQDASGNVITSTYLNEKTKTVKTAAEVTDASMKLTDKYPSMAAARQIAASVSSEALMNLVTEDGAGVVKSIVRDETGDFVVEKDYVTSDDLASNSVTTVKITNLNVTTDKLAADAVTNAKLADNAVQSENIKDGEVKEADLAPGAVTPAKTSGVVGYIPSGSATATTYAQIWVQ